MELEKRGSAITAIQEKNEEFDSDTDSEMESRSPHVTFQDDGMQSPDYSATIASIKREDVGNADQAVR